MSTLLQDALHAEDASTRLRAALAVGSDPRSALVGVLVERCAVETDFHVRDMLTWALTRHPLEITVPRLVAELSSSVAQARSQALHTLSKIRDAGTWRAITPALLSDPDDEVARSAWRAAVVLVPDAERGNLALLLATQFGRGDEGVQRSLSRALVALGSAAIEPVVREAMESAAQVVRAHAAATERLLLDPESGIEPGLREAKRAFVLAGSR